MPRPPRQAPAGLVYHVLNRGNAGRRLFETNGDYFAFVRILAQVQGRVPMRLLAWCLMPTHWHLVVWPQVDGSLSDFVRLVTLTHTQRWHAWRTSAGTGHLYQGRFKSFIVQQDEHLLTVCRYVERNALRANLVSRAEDWRWGSLRQRCREESAGSPRLDAWPVPVPSDWVSLVNQPASATELEALRRCAQRGAPYGAGDWIKATVSSLRLESTLRQRGRPSKEEKVPDTFF